MAALDGPSPSKIRIAFGSVLSFFILILIGVLAFSIRLFSVKQQIFHFSCFVNLGWEMLF